MTALILGIISIAAGLIPIAAWILGVTARTDVRRSGLMDESQATAGIAPRGGVRS